VCGDCLCTLVHCLRTHSSQNSHSLATHTHTHTLSFLVAQLACCGDDCPVVSSQSGLVVKDSSVPQDHVKDLLHHHGDSTISEGLVTALIKRSSVLSAKDHSAWDMEAVLSLLEGPLATPRGMELATKQKWLRRLFGFFNPSGAFVHLTWNGDNLAYARAAAQLVRVCLKMVRTHVCGAVCYVNVDPRILSLTYALMFCVST
jgi:hypothetical protein